jgi:uncharacterized protein YvpB
MGRSLAFVRVLALGLVIAAGMGPRLARADSARHLDAWATVRGTQPGPGCSVDVSVEVRADGAAVAGLAVAIALFDSGNDVISSDEELTGDDGVAWLSVTTGGADNDWLDVDVAGAYLGGLSILPTAGADCGTGVREIEGATDAVVPDAPAAQSGDSGGFPTHYQEHSLSCEYAAIQIVTTWFGAPIYEDESLAFVPQAVDPHFGFRGDIDGPYGSSDDYGVYAEALVPLLNAYGYNGDVWYSADAGSLESELDAGHPTLLWIATRGDTGFYDQDANGNTFKLVPWEHVVVAYAYDDGGVSISDPGTGALDYLSWGWLLNAWSVLDGMALSIYPA